MESEVKGFRKTSAHANKVEGDGAAPLIINHNKEINSVS